MTERYVELHAASAFSFLEGASQPEELIERAVELEMPAMALLDRNGVYGSARFHTSAKRNGIRAHVGAEIAVSSFGPRLTPPHGCRISTCRNLHACLCSASPGLAIRIFASSSRSSRCGRRARRRRSHLRRPAAVRLRPGLPDRWRRRTVGCGARERRRRGRPRDSRTAGTHLRQRQCLRRSCSGTMNAKRSGGIRPRSASRNR